MKYAVEKILAGGGRVRVQEFDTYAEAERWVVWQTDHEIKNYDGWYLPVYDIIKQGEQYENKCKL